MWGIDNQTVYAAERNWTRDKQGVHHWLVAVKATFTLGEGGKLALADEQLPPTLAPEYRGEPATSSLRLDSDLLAPKPGTDIIVDASAHAPGGRPATTVPVSLRLGPVEKTLVVHGVRVYYQGAVGITESAPRPFVTRPIHYEWAFGGTDLGDEDPRKHRIDTRNPVGKGFAVDRGRLVDQPAHAIEYPQGNAAKMGPAGFGPIASFWSPRLELAGTYDQGWEKSKKPLLPDDYDERFALCGPADQRTPKPLRGGEPVQLSNMTPGPGLVRFALPKIFLTFATRFGERVEEHRATLATVAIVATEMKVMLVWQSTLPVAARDVEHLDLTTIKEKPFV